MSRCFPYPPPPGYVRNPVAVAEVETTTKLHKEKAEKKKEKRNEKKVLQQFGGETSKQSKRTHKKRKHGDLIAGQQSREATKETVVQLEKSGLTEEHEAPCFPQAAHGSPESSQDSSKRRKVVLPSPSQNKNGSILRIKIRRDQDSPAAMLDNSRVLKQPSLQQMGSCSSLKQNFIEPYNIKGVVEPTAALQHIRKGSQAVGKQMSELPPAEVTQRFNIDTAKVMQKIDPRLPVNPAMDRLHPPSSKVMSSADASSPAKLTRRVVPPPEKAAQRVDLCPAKVLQNVDLPPLGTYAPPSTVNVSQKEVRGVAFCQAREQQPPLLQKSSVPVETCLIKQKQQTNTLPKKEEPSFSGRNTEAAAVQEVKRSKSDRKKNRKAEKKEKKFGHLFVSWNPPSLEMKNTGDLGDQDWLIGGTSNPDASMSECAENDGLAQFQAIEQQFLLQPRAIHLPDLHFYQLPYVVPF